MKEFKTKKQELIEEPYEITNGSDILDCFYSKKINSFCLRFNAVLWTYKTWNGFVKKKQYFIDKYNLNQYTYEQENFN